MPELELTQTLDDATLFASIFGISRSAVVDQTLDNVGLTAVAFQTNQARVDQHTAEVRLSAHLVADLPPGTPGAPGTPFIEERIYNLTGTVTDRGGAILVFTGPIFKSVEWRLISGHGTLTPFTTFTDEKGQCSCRFDAAGFVEQVIVGVAFVP